MYSSEISHCNCFCFIFILLLLHCYYLLLASTPLKWCLMYYFFANQKCCSIKVFLSISISCTIRFRQSTLLFLTHIFKSTHTTATCWKKIIIHFQTYLQYLVKYSFNVYLSKVGFLALESLVQQMSFLLIYQWLSATCMNSCFSFLSPFAQPCPPIELAGVYPQCITLATFPHLICFITKTTVLCQDAKVAASCGVVKNIINSGSDYLDGT